MSIFKCAMNTSYKIESMRILCLNEPKKYDFEIENSKQLNKEELLMVCLQSMFINPDKLYILKFKNNICVKPNNKNIEEHDYGLIDIEHRRIERIYNYKHKKVVSFCLYGKNKMYTIGAIQNLKQYTKQYPDVKCYFYVRKDVDDKIIEEIKKNNGYIIECIDHVNWYMMFTRFFPFENPENKFYLSRDCDCRLIEREIQSIKKWMNSDKKFHIIRDHPWHFTLILGGMWGSRDYHVRDLRFMIMDWCMEYIKLKQERNKGPDQFFLKQLYKIVQSEIYVHDEFFNYENKKYTINHIRKNKEYIGEAYDENEVIDQKLRDVINK